jgi:hypothetical protein
MQANVARGGCSLHGVGGPRDDVNVASTQPNPLIQLAHVLQWELWNHEQARAALVLEQIHCAELQEYILKPRFELDQWRELCNTVYTSLNEHRAEHATLMHDMDGLVANSRSIGSSSELR